MRDEQQLLNATGGDQDVADDMFEAFMRELPGEVSAIIGHFNASDWDRLWETVHRLHGASSICGVPALNAVIVKLGLTPGFAGIIDPSTTYNPG